MNRLRWAGLFGFTALLAALAFACGESTEVVDEGRCKGVSCSADQSCDPADGACKCGGAGGVVCLPEQECALDPTPRCFSSQCQFTVCERGEICDRLTGECGCGEERCAEGEVCVEQRCQQASSCDEVVCANGLSCDPVDGACKCGGERCEALESCIEGQCAQDRCAGVNCPTNSACSADDGECHCGGYGGPICRLGEACTEVEGEFDCVVSDLCDGVSCVGGTVCDPTDGECRCGGVGDLAPVCTSEQSCIDGECRGGGLCPGPGEPSHCATGTSCDPADGQCKCGGVGGSICGEGELCMRIAGQVGCRARCELGPPATGCARGEGCYLDPRSPELGLFCAEAGASSLNQPCTDATECEPGHYCNASAGRCRRFCAPSHGSVGCTGVGMGTAACAQIPGAPPDVGYCISEG